MPHRGYPVLTHTLHCPQGAKWKGLLTPYTRPLSREEEAGEPELNLKEKLLITHPITSFWVLK